MNESRKLRQKRLPVKNPWLCRAMGNVGGLISELPREKALLSFGGWSFCAVKERPTAVPYRIGRGVCGVPPPLSTPPLSLPSITETLLGARYYASERS